MIEKIRIESISDFKGVRNVYVESYGNYEYSDIIDLLRLDKNRYLNDMSIVYLDDNKVIGHLMLFPIRIVKNDNIKYASVMMLPIGILPEYRGYYIDKDLISIGIDIATQKGFTSIVTIGDIEYFSRFGFEEAKDKNISSDKDDLLVFEIKENGGLIGIDGKIEVCDLLKKL